MDGGGLCSAGEGENVVLQRYKGDEMAKAAIFSPSCCKRKKGWKELCCQEKVLIRRYGWCYSSESRCYVSVTSVHSHHKHYIWSVQFNSTLFTNNLLRSRMSPRFTWQKHCLLRSNALNDFKDFCKRVRMRWKSLRANLNMKTKCLHANNMKRRRQISLGILIHEKAGTIAAQSSSVIQSQRLWCEKGELTWKGRQIAEGTFI